MGNKVFRAALVGVMVCFLGIEVGASTLIHKNIQSLVEGADRIFLGTCLAIEEGSSNSTPAGRVGYTEYRFRVDEAVKPERSPGRIEVFRQPRALPERALHGGVAWVAARSLSDPLLQCPSYVVGEQYLIFLSAENAWGLTSPVGLVQGAFRIQIRADGLTAALNGIDNLGLFLDVERQSAARAMSFNAQERAIVRQGKGPVDLRVLLPLARKLQRLQPNR